MIATALIVRMPNKENDNKVLQNLHIFNICSVCSPLASHAPQVLNDDVGFREIVISEYVTESDLSVSGNFIGRGKGRGNTIPSSVHHVHCRELERYAGGTRTMRLCTG